MRSAGHAPTTGAGAGINTDPGQGARGGHAKVGRGERGRGEGDGVAEDVGGTGTGVGVMRAPVLTGLGLAVIGVVFLVRYMTRRWTAFDLDEFMFALVGRDVLDGHVPFSGVFDNKPPGLIYLFASTEAVFGRSPTAVHVLGATAAAATAALSYRDAPLRRVPLPAALAVAALVSTLIVFLDGWAAMSELLACPALIMANQILLRPDRPAGARLIAAGALLGVACQISYLAAPLAGPTALAASVIGRPRLKAGLQALALIGLGFAGATLLVWGPQIATGNLVPMLQAQFAYHLHYRVQFSPTGFILGLLSPLYVLVVPFLAVVPASVRSDDRPAALIFALQLAGALAVTAVSNRFYLHYLLLTLPAVSGLLALLLSGNPRRNWTFAAAILLVSSAVYLLMDVTHIPERWAAGRFDRMVTSAIERNVGRGRPVLVFDESASFYFLSGSRPVTRYVFSRHYMPTCSESIMERPDTVLAEGLRRRPALVLLGQDCSSIESAASAVAAAGYRFTGRLSLGPRQVDVYTPR